MPASPSVTVDVRMLRHAGIGTYIRNVVPRVAAKRPNWRFTFVAAERALPEWSASLGAVVRARANIYSAAEQVELPRLAAGSDLLWSPHYVVPLLGRAKQVVTVHDVGHLSLSPLYGGGLRALYARGMFAAVKRRAVEVIYDSEFTRSEFHRLVGNPRRETVIPLGVDPSWRLPATGPVPHTRPYILFLGSIKPHKNVGALLAAFSRIADSVVHDLVIVGNAADQRTLDEDALRNIQRLGTRARFVGDADDAMVKRFVANAAVLVVPSLFEGFGLTVVEAMAAGCPCIVSSAASLPEVGGDAVLYCNPRDPSTIAAQLTRVLGDDALRTRLISAGRDRARTFDWETTAERTVQVLERGLQFPQL